jgi:hypothetical protein
MCGLYDTNGDDDLVGSEALLSDNESVTWKQKASYILNLGWLAGWLEPRGGSSLYERF